MINWKCFLGLHQWIKVFEDEHTRKVYYYNFTDKDKIIVMRCKRCKKLDISLKYDKDTPIRNKDRLEFIDMHINILNKETNPQKFYEWLVDKQAELENVDIKCKCILLTSNQIDLLKNYYCKKFFNKNYFMDMKLKKVNNILQSGIESRNKFYPFYEMVGDKQ